MSVLAPPTPRSGPAPLPRTPLRTRWQSRTRRSAGERLVYALLVLAVAVPVMTSQWGLYTPDIKIEVYLNPWHRLLLDLSTWLPDPQAGIGNYNLGLAPVDLVVAVVRTLGAGPEVAVRVLKLVLVLLGAWGALRFLEEIFGRRTDAVMRVATVALFLFNPFAVVGANQLAIQLPMTVLPWLLIAVMRAVRCGGWRWPAVAALLVFSMSGMNMGVAPAMQVVAVPAVVIWTAWHWSVRLGAVVAALARLAGLVLAVSCYWMIPAAFAFGTATGVVDNTETVEAISGVSSYSEVLRGLGMWTMYGTSPTTGPWQPGFAAYLDNPFVIMASFAFPTLALAGLALRRDRATALAFAVAASAAVVMVGQHPVDDRSPLGRLIETVFADVPGTIAFRTTNKAGPALALGFAVLGAVAIAALAPRLRSLPSRSVGIGSALIVLALLAQPMAVGEMYTGRWAIPGYWETVGARLEQGSPQARVWWMPGQVLARYRWSTDSEDDLPYSILDTRPSLLRTTRPTGSPELSNFLAAIDGGLQEASTLPTTVSAASRYLGVGQVFLRNDVDWNAFHGLRTLFVQDQLDADPGLDETAVLGRPGLNVLRGGPGTSEDIARRELGTNPLHFYDVAGQGTLVRGEPAGTTLLVDGDAYAFSWLEQLGYLKGQRSFRYVGGLDLAAFEDSLGPAHAIVITDTNRRRNMDQTVLQDNLGPLLEPGGTLVKSRTLFGEDTATQTVQAWDGAAGIETDVPGVPLSSAAGVANAFDGSRESVWIGGDLSASVVGTGATVRLLGPTPIGRVSIATRFGGVGASAFTVSAGGVSRTAEVGRDGRVVVDLSGVVARSVRIEVAAVTPAPGFAYPPVRVESIDIDGVRIRPVTRTPTVVSDLASELDSEGRARLDSTPISVVLARDAAGPFAEDDREAQLSRDVAFPARRTLDAVGIALSTPPPTPGRCMTVATVDGTPLKVKQVPTGFGYALAPGHPWLFTGCSPVTLEPGVVRVRPVAGVRLDALALQDARALAPAGPSAVSAAQIESTSTTGTVARFPAEPDARFAVFSQSWGAGWRATVDGVSQEPIVLDGHAAAFRLAPGASHEVRLWYEPQSSVVPARILSAVGLVACLLLALAPWPLRRRRLLGASPHGVPRGASTWLPGAPVGRRRLLGAAVAVALVWFFAGIVPSLAVALAAAVVGRSRPGAVRAMWGAVIMMAAVPFVWMAAAMGSWGVISPDLVTASRVPGQLAAIALGLACLGLLLDAADRRWTSP